MLLLSYQVNLSIREGPLFEKQGKFWEGEVTLKPTKDAVLIFLLPVLKKMPSKAITHAYTECP